MKRLHILVEGQTEERFAKDILVPHLAGFACATSVSIVETSRPAAGGKFRGGIASFGKVERDIRRLLRDGSRYLTTLFDFYGLPNDFPGCASVGFAALPAPQKAETIEAALMAHFGADHFLPFLQLHEFEAFIFAGPDIAAAKLERPNLAAGLSKAVSEAGSIELVNDGPKTHPHARIESLYPTYSKVADGSSITQSIGLAQLRQASPRLDRWLQKLESLV